MKIIALLFAAVILLAAAYAKQECDYSAEIILESNEFASEDFKFRIKAVKIEGPSTNITAQISITNYNNTAVKSYKPWTNSPISRQKTSGEYSPNLEEGNYEITAEIFVLCDDFEKENNLDKRKVTIKPLIAAENVAAENKTESVNLKENENPAPLAGYNNKFNDTEEIKSPVTEANTVYAQNQKNPKAEICSQSQENQIPTEEKTINQQLTENQPAGKIIYESSIEKSKDLIIYMLLGISILLNIVLIWKR